jgi:hypothetical protein
MLLALLGGGYLVLNSKKPSKKITPLIPPPTEEQKKKGYYFIYCGKNDGKPADVVILDTTKAYDYAYRKGLVVKPDKFASTFELDITDNCFSEKSKDSPEKTTQKDFDKYLPKLQFFFKLFGYYVLGYLEGPNIPPNKENLILLDNMINKIISTYTELYKHLNTSKLTNFTLPKGFDFDKECKLTITNKEKAYRYFYNIGLTKLPYLEKADDYNLFLFENCFKLFNDENDDELDYKSLSALNKEQAKFIYDGLRYMFLGFITTLAAAGKSQDGIETAKSEFMQMLNKYRSFFNDLGIDSSKWNTDLPSKPANL